MSTCSENSSSKHGTLQYRHSSVQRIHRPLWGFKFSFTLSPPKKEGCPYLHLLQKFSWRLLMLLPPLKRIFLYQHTVLVSTGMSSFSFTKWLYSIMCIGKYLIRQLIMRKNDQSWLFYLFHQGQQCNRRYHSSKKFVFVSFTVQLF